MESTFASIIPSTSGAPNHPSEPAVEHPATFIIHRITIKHPGYGGNNTLLALPACDGISKSHAHYATVHAACSIIAYSSADGWLSPSRNGEPRTEPDTEGLVPAGVYFFHVTTEDGEPFAVFPNFRVWPFRYGKGFVLWRQAAYEATALVSPAAPRTTETCRITNKSLACETSHIVPTSEKSWFADNEMDQYGELGGRTGQDVADCASNLLRLRRDVHYLWDNYYFSIVPKCTPESGDKGTWHTHSMSQDQEVYEDFHNKPTEPLAGRTAEYLFARFAWDIFPKLIGFLQSSQPRRLAVRQANGDVDVKFYTPPECRRFAEAQGRGRSASPTKRSRKDDSDSLAEEAEIDCYSRKRPRTCSTLSDLDCLDSGVSDMSQSSSWNHGGPPVRLELFKRTEGCVDGYEPRGRTRHRGLALTT
ncbi:hypothetical protein LTR09_012077 [Extremus antarcticus]|uniref:HNH nuclease domain-containing protein n=1 Tax=Extremus antarcticus TaxID=702011 RepID=A0AAJ0D5J1_9PEZI|nr:hypothetical protein LTR09_012077 [Extremus antarcticus]